LRPDLIVPIGLLRGPGLDSGNDLFGHGVQQGCLGRNEAVKGHQAAAERGRQSSHGDSLGAISLDELDRCGDDALAG
jgi:hypothetical protein